MPEVNNLFHSPSTIPDKGAEVFEILHQSNKVLIERIISNQASSPTGFWYDQQTDEWVVLLQGEAVLQFESGDTHVLKSGDHLFIPRHHKHRIESTSKDALWLAVHLKE